MELPESRQLERFERENGNNWRVEMRLSEDEQAEADLIRSTIARFELQANTKLRIKLPTFYRRAIHVSLLMFLYLLLTDVILLAILLAFTGGDIFFEMWLLRPPFISMGIDAYSVPFILVTIIFNMTLLCCFRVKTVNSLRVKVIFFVLHFLWALFIVSKAFATLIPPFYELSLIGEGKQYDNPLYPIVLIVVFVSSFVTQVLPPLAVYFVFATVFIVLWRRRRSKDSPEAD